MAMSCIDNNHIQKFIDGESTPKEAARINKHIAGCENCAASIDHQRDLATRFKKAINLLAEETLEIPGIAVPPAQIKKHFFRAKRLIYVVAAACVLLFILVIRHRKEPEIRDEIITLESGFASGFDANRTVSQQPLIITITDSKGNVSEYFN
jgi:hypothetical protein